MKGKCMTQDTSVGLSEERLLSIDALRGFAMLWIIGGGAFIRSLEQVWKNAFTLTLYEHMEHADWQGFRFLDLIFPLFLFVVGVILPFSVLRRLEKGEPLGSTYRHVLKRTIILIILGLINYGLLRFDWEQMRWSSVLGRIGICYFFACVLLIHTNWRIQAFIAAAIMILYWAVVMFIPVPGHGPGVLTPEGCLTTYLDQLMIPGKLGLGLYDRQGVLSTFTALSTTLLGVLAGHWLRSQRSPQRKTLGLLGAGIAGLILGYGWGRSFFISRNVWTSSFVLVSAGWSSLLLAAFYWVIDVKGYRNSAFFVVVIGMNAIAIWCAQRFIDFGAIASFFVGGVARCAGAYQPIILSFCTLMTKWLALWFLYRNKIFFKA
jgi:predicted acyltransferase